MVRYNTDNSALEVYESSVWDQLSGGVVDTVVGTANEIDVNSTDPANPIVSLSSTLVFPGTITASGVVTLRGVKWPASDGSSNTFLQTDGAGQSDWSTYSMPASVSASGTVLRSNGTNYVASTSTFADTYAASALLYSNGANTVTGLATANSARS